jgi:phytoene dehydrogenase-like protein
MGFADNIRKPEFPMKQKKVLIIGGGIAGLCTGIYLQKNGFDTEILEMHAIAGGLATAWKRNGYTFENCIHWFVGSREGEDLYSTWKEVFDVGRLDFYSDPIFQVLEKGNSRLVIYKNVDLLEKELLTRAPEDSIAIRDFTGLVRKLSALRLPGGKNLFEKIASYVKATPYLWILSKYSKITMADYAKRFKNPLLRQFFGAGFGELSLLAIAFSLAWMARENAGYPIGGSLQLIRLIEEQYRKLGGILQFGTKVDQIIVENNRAAGVLLENGRKLPADIVISAADAHTTLFHMLQGKFVSDAFERAFKAYKPFPSYIQVSLGVGADLKNEPGALNLTLENAIALDLQTQSDLLSFRIFNFDPTFSPANKTAVTCFIATDNFAYWVSLRATDRTKYNGEKERIAGDVIRIFEDRFPAAKGKIEVVDVATPATVIRYTGNWKGSMEGWLMTPKTGIRQLPMCLPSVNNFYMAGQWLTPGGGLPSGLLTARKVVQRICREQHKKFRADRVW